jgi:hypothetical protein
MLAPVRQIRQLQLFARQNAFGRTPCPAHSPETSGKAISVTVYVHIRKVSSYQEFHSERDRDNKNLTADDFRGVRWGTQPGGVP